MPYVIYSEDAMQSAKRTLEGTPSMQDIRLAASTAIFSLCSVLVVPAQVAQAAPVCPASQYATEDLGGGPGTLAYALNSAGDVVGAQYTDTGRMAFVSTVSGGFRALGTLGGIESGAHGINNVGQVVGGSETDSQWRAFIWSESSGMVAIETSNLAGSEAYAINDRSEVVGYLNGTGAFYWTAATGAVPIEGVADAIAINNAGQVAGNSVSGIAVIWTPAGGIQELGTLGGAGSQAVDINEAGHVLGWTDTSAGQYVPFLWTAEAGMTALDIPADGLPASARLDVVSLNDSGQIFGDFESEDPNDPDSTLVVSFVWTPGCSRVDLLPAWPSARVIAGNDAGQIAVFLQEPANPYRSVRLRVAVNAGNTQPGVNVPVDLSGGTSVVGGISLAFSQVFSSGNTTVAPSSGGIAPPTGYRIVGLLSGLPHYWDLNTTATYSGSISVCIHYDPTQVIGNGANLRLVHGESNGWTDITLPPIDTTHRIICGTTASLSPFAVIEPLPADVTPPVLSLPANLTVAATSARGTAVRFAASAADAVDGRTPISCTPPSNSNFALGTSTVSCTASDHSGNTATGSFSVSVHYSWSGFLPPINADGSSAFKLGGAVPVKFKLTGASVAIANAAANLWVAKITNGGVGSDIEATSADANDSTFRYDRSANQYTFNLSTKGKAWTKGTYRLRVDLHDGVGTRTVTITLK